MRRALVLRCDPLPPGSGGPSSGASLRVGLFGARLRARSPRDAALPRAGRAAPGPSSQRSRRPEPRS
eukprot:9080463-Alexandrium_andersonii.AAC.1